MDLGLAKSTCLCFIIVINWILCRRYGVQIELGSHYANRTFYVLFVLKIHRDPG